jgi:ATP-binding cassette subfamily B protein
VERGTHEELLAAEGRYEELHRTQFAVQKNVAAEEEAVSGA